MNFLVLGVIVLMSSSMLPQQASMAQSSTFQGIDKYGQEYSSRCKTPTSSCFLDDEQEVGSPCYCGDSFGIVTND